MERVRRRIWLSGLMSLSNANRQVEILEGLASDEYKAQNSTGKTVISNGKGLKHKSETLPVN